METPEYCLKPVQSQRRQERYVKTVQSNKKDTRTTSMSLLLTLNRFHTLPVSIVDVK